MPYAGIWGSPKRWLHGGVAGILLANEWDKARALKRGGGLKNIRKRLQPRSWSAPAVLLVSAAAVMKAL